MKLLFILGLALGYGSGFAPVTFAASISPDQSIFESVELNGGSATLNWNIPFGGGTLVSGASYFYGMSSGGMNASPNLAGPQFQSPVLTAVDPALSIPPVSVSRILQNGQVNLLPASATRKITYSGNSVQIDYLGEDNSSTLVSILLYGFEVHSLDSFMENSPEELQAFLPLKDWVGFNNFSSSAKWNDRSVYLKRKSHRNGETIYAEDCGNGTGSSNAATAIPAPCKTGVTLDNFFPISLGTNQTNGAEADFAPDGTITTKQGVRIWVANAQLSEFDSPSEAYRVFFELNGNVYRGMLEKDGAVLNTQQTDGSVVDYSIQFNQAALKSIEAGLITGTVIPGSKAGDATEVNTVDIFGIGAHGVNGSLTPVDLRAHYDIPDSLTGVGQTIAIVDAPGSGDVEDDLTTFSNYNHLPLCTTANGCFQHIDLSSGSVVPATVNWIGEIALDTQMVHGIAPNAKIILVTAAVNNGVIDLIGAINAAAAIPGVTAVSMSFGAGSQFASAEDPILASFQANQGTIFFGSSGDNGNLFRTIYPGSSPYVTSVGGTRINSLSWSTSSDPSSVETAWEFSTGGQALTTAMPAWQTSFLNASAITANSNLRSFPDVSSVADWRHSAVGVYYRQGWRMAGGTSAGAPLWAGIAALFGEYLNKEGKSLQNLIKATPGGFNGLLYQSKLSAANHSAFFDIVSGTNNVTGATCAYCSALPGYDNVTGLGSPDVANLFSYF